MENGMNMVMVVCASFAALALGVLLGHACCKGLFALLRAHAPALEAPGAKVEAPIASSIASSYRSHVKPV
jgi:hypothetical protein